MTDPGFVAVANGLAFHPIASSTALGSATLEQRLQLACNCCAALASLHDAGIVHGCIDSASVLVNPMTQEVRLGAARGGGAAGGEPEAPHRLPDLAFAAPEMLGRLDIGVDHRSDLYGMGAVLYLLFAGRPPFASNDSAELVHSHLAREAVPARELDPQLPQAVSDILQKLLAKMPEDRYQSVHGLAFDLGWCRDHLHGEPAAEPFRAGARDQRGVLRLPDALIDRSRQLDVISGLCERVRHAQVHVVWVRGRAGVGKSALVRRGVERGARAGMVVSAKFDQLENNEPHVFAKQAIAEMVKRVLAAPDDEVARWRTALARELGSGMRLIADLVPSIELLVGPQAALPSIAPAESKNRFSRALQAFLRVGCSAEKPLYLILDDLQWADRGSLELLGYLLSTPGLAHFMVVAAFREGYDHAGSPIAEVLASAGRGPYDTHMLRLGPLDVQGTASFLSTTLECDARQADPLAALLHQKTGGNPFFIGQFLRFLHTRGLMAFDYAAGAWRWDIARVQAEGISDDVLALMDRKLDQLPAPTREVLSMAALMGAAFDLDTLAHVAQQKPKATFWALRRAVEAGLLFQASAADDATGTWAYRFVHDQVQQAACARLSEDEVRRRRLAIGVYLLGRLGASGEDTRSFTAADNLNHASRLIHDPSLRADAAALDRSCARRARESGAFLQAFQYAQAGLELLGPHAWQTHHSLCLDLSMQAFECAYITGRLAEANQRFAEILAHARTREARAGAYYTRILVATSLGDSHDAIRLGVEGLRPFGHSLAAFPSRVALVTELARVLLQLRNRPAEGLEALPEMQNADVRAALRLLMSVCPAAYFLSPNLMSQAALRIMRLSLKHGNAPESPFGYVLFGLVAGAVLGRYATGHAFGQLAVRLARKGEDPVLRSKVIMIHAGFLSYWCAPIDESLVLLDESRRLALGVGDIQYANYSILQTLFLSLARGVPLESVLEECRRHEGFIDQTQDEFSIVNRRIREQFVLALRSRERPLRELDFAAFDAAVHGHGQSGSKNLTTETSLTVVKVQLAFYAGRHDEAWRLSEEAERDIEALMSQIMVAEHYFFRALVLAHLMGRGAARASKDRKQLARIVARFKLWSAHCPANFGGHFLLLRAVWASLFEQADDAPALFDRAIAHANAQGAHYLAGIAAELAGRREFSLGRWAEGRARVGAALGAYTAWGAQAKVRELGASVLGANAEAAGEASGEASEEARPSAEAASAGHFGGIEQLGALDRFVASSEKLGSVGASDQLFATLMRHVIESSGASAGTLVMVQDDSACSAVAHGRNSDASDAGIDISVSPAALSDLASETLVRYALRSAEPLILTSPHADPRFRDCEHLRRVRPASALCLPLNTTASTVGVLYLENRLLRDAFVIARMPLLPLLARQLALVLQNARAFRSLARSERSLDEARVSVDTLQRVQSQLSKFVPRSVQEQIEASPDTVDFTPRDEDVSVMFVDIAGYTALTELVGAQPAQKIVERYFASYLDVIEGAGGEINEIAGDGLMVIFRHADGRQHALQAVAAALAIQATTRRLNREGAGGQWILVNVGINSGIGTIGAKKLEGSLRARWTFTATGSVTNLAARIVQAAQGGVVLASTETAARVRGSYATASLGPRRFKGFSQEMPVYLIGKAEPDGGSSAPSESIPMLQPTE